MITGTEGSATVSGVLLGVDTHLDLHVGVWFWINWAEKPGRFDRADDQEGLREPPRLGGKFPPHQVQVRRSGGNQQSLRCLKLARYLRAMVVVPVMEIERPKRRHLRRKGKGRTLSMPRSRCSGGALRRGVGRAQEERAETGAWR